MNISYRSKEYFSCFIPQKNRVKSILILFEAFSYNLQFPDLIYRDLNNKIFFKQTIILPLVQYLTLYQKF